MTISPINTLKTEIDTFFEELPSSLIGEGKRVSNLDSLIKKIEVFLELNLFFKPNSIDEDTLKTLSGIQLALEISRSMRIFKSNKKIKSCSIEHLNIYKTFQAQLTESMQHGSTIKSDVVRILHCNRGLTRIIKRIQTKLESSSSSNSSVKATKDDVAKRKLSSPITPAEKKGTQESNSPANSNSSESSSETQSPSSSATQSPIVPLYRDPLPPVYNCSFYPPVSQSYSYPQAALTTPYQPTPTTMASYQPAAAVMASYQPTPTTMASYQPAAAVMNPYQPTATVMASYQPTPTTMASYQAPVEQEVYTTPPHLIPVTEEDIRTLELKRLKINTELMLLRDLDEAEIRVLASSSPESIANFSNHENLVAINKKYPLTFLAKIPNGRLQELASLTDVDTEYALLDRMSNYLQIALDVLNIPSLDRSYGITIALKPPLQKYIIGSVKIDEWTLLKNRLMLDNAIAAFKAARTESIPEILTLLNKHPFEARAKKRLEEYTTIQSQIKFTLREDARGLGIYRR